MEILLEHQVPSFVSDSSYLVSLLENGSFPDEGIEIPKGCAKKDLSITRPSDLTILLKTLQFWMVPEVLNSCKEFYVFAFNAQNQSALQDSAAEFESTIPLVSTVAQVAHNIPTDYNKISFAISRGCLHLLRFLCEEMEISADGGLLQAALNDEVECFEYLHHRGEKLTRELNQHAAHAASLKCLRYLRDQGVQFDQWTFRDAAASGCLECLKFVLQNQIDGVTAGYDKCLLSAAHEGQLHIIEYLWEEYSTWRTVHSERHIVLAAAESGHLPILEFAHVRGFSYFATPTSGAELVTAAAQGGHLHCLQYLHGLGQVLSESSMISAAIGGHYDCIHFLLQHNCPINLSREYGEWLFKHNTSFDDWKLLFELGLPCDASTTAAVAATGKLEDLKYLRERGCPWDERTCNSAAREGHIDCLRYAHENGCFWTIKNGRVNYQTSGTRNVSVAISAARASTTDCLKYVVEQGIPMNVELALVAANAPNALRYLLSVGCPVDAEVFRAAVRNLECMLLLYESRCPWDEKTCIAAAACNKLESLRFLHERGCPWDARVCREASSVDVLQYAHENGCPWDEETCTSAVERESLACLRYAQENGCPWNARVCARAAQRATPESLNCLRFAHENGCPWDKQTCANAASSNNLAALVYAHEHGCPWDEDVFRRARTKDCYEYAVAHGCPGAELSRFHDPDYAEMQYSDNDDDIGDLLYYSTYLEESAFH